MANQAIQIILDQVILPALESKELSKEYKNKVQRSKTLFSNFKKSGDMYRYLRRFKDSHGSNNDDLFYELKRLDLKTFEDILPVIEEKFGHELEDTTVLDDFVIGKSYSSFDIAIMAQTYDVQSGIYIIGDDKNTQAVFIKATLENGVYPNTWLVKNEELKYYMYAPQGKYNPEYKYNKAIINSKDIPIYVFIKNDTNCYLTGIFEYVKYIIEEDGSKWFRLRKINSINTNRTITLNEYDRELEKQVSNSLNTSKEERQKRLENAPKKPERINTVVSNFKRNPDVIAAALERAAGVCEDCGNGAPFNRASDGSPYLEVHHMKPLSQGGEDTVENALALCPNCHRKAHFGVR